MDAIDLIILTETDAAAAAGAAQSIAQLYSLVGTFKDRRDAFDRLYAELCALKDILETLRMSLDSSSSRVTKDQQQLPKESRRLLEACKIVCDKFYADFSDVMRHSTSLDRMKYNSKLQRKADAASDAAAKLHVWKMNLGLVAEVMQLSVDLISNLYYNHSDISSKPNGTDMFQANQVEMAIENFRQAISLELDQVDSELKSTGEWLGNLDEMDSMERDVAYQMLLPLRVRQAALSRSTGMCQIAAEALKSKQAPQAAETFATRPHLATAGVFYPSRRTTIIYKSQDPQDHSLLCIGHTTLEEFKSLVKQVEQGGKGPVA